MSTIPEKWKVKITEDNREVLELWRIKQPKVDLESQNTCLYPPALNKWLISDRYDSTYMNWNLNFDWREEYTEITFEEFKQFVLKENKPQFKIGDKVIIKRDSEAYGTNGWRGELQNIIQTQGYLTISNVFITDNNTQNIGFRETKYRADSPWLTLYTENKTEMKTYKVTIDQLKQIHDVACVSWKSKIKSLITDPFADYIELSQSQVDEMFKAATKDQRPVLVSVFGEPVAQCPYKKGQLLWVWEKKWKYPLVGIFQKMKDDEDRVYVTWGPSMETSWLYSAPFNNGQLPEQFKHLLENQ